MAELTIKSFQGGITDDYLDGDLSSAKKMDNLFLDKFGKLYQRPGFDIYSADAPQIPPGNQQIDSLYYFQETLFAKSGTRLYYLEDGALSWVTLDGPNAHAFADSALGVGVSWSEWRGHLYATPHPGTAKTGSRTVKIYIRATTSNWYLVQAGLPTIEPFDWAGLVTSSGTEHSYIFAVVFRVNYSALINGNPATFYNYGIPSYQQKDVGLLGAGSNFNPFASANFVNGPLDNYQDAVLGGEQIKIAEYNTKADEQTLYWTDQVLQGADIKFDRDQDDAAFGDPASLVYEDLPILYTNGGASVHGPVPHCFFSVILDGYGFYAAGIEPSTGFSYPGRIWQSNPSYPEGVFEGNFVDVPGNITAFSYVGSYPIVFTEDKVYRIEGRFDAFGGGGMRAKLISDHDGCVAPAGAFRRDSLVYFATRDGFSITDGFKAWKTAEHLRRTYADFESKETICGAYDVSQNKIFIGVESDLSTVTGCNNSMLAIDTSWGSADRSTFTTLSSEDRLRPTSVHYDHRNSRFLIGDKRGYVFTFPSTNLTTDPKVNTATAYSTWSRKAVVYDYISTAWTFGSLITTKWVTRIYMIFKNLTGNLSVDVFSYNDDKATPKQLKIIRERSTVTEGLHQVWRWFKRQGLRCNYKQVQIKKGLVTLFRSDDYDTAGVDGAGNTAQLNTGVWPNDGVDSLVGHTLYLETDNYTAGWEISVHSGDTLTLIDTGNTLPTNSVLKWEVRGYPKNEKFEMHGFTVEYSEMGNTFKPFPAGGEGGNS